jgi:hypothetical protein
MNMPGLYAGLGTDQDERSSLHGVGSFLKGPAWRLEAILSKIWQDAPAGEAILLEKYFQKIDFAPQLWNLG